ncbi:MAG: hypothetical protein FJ265_11770 [Planctomycetes bacterium]|nr:hypothetical protein [Planctomycetota bacterium]
MPVARWSPLANPAAWYAAFGVAVLAATVWLPYLTAERTARVEGRADQIAGLLLEAARDFPDAIEPADVDHVVARLFALAARDGAHVADLERHRAPLPGTLLVLENKHYLFQLAASPVEAQAVPSRGAVPSYQVAAWPVRDFGPGHSAFFVALDAPRAYTRNLTAGYVGTGEQRPRPERLHRRPSSTFEPAKSYRSLDDERWIVY